MTRHLTPRELAEATGDHDAIHGPARHLDAKDMIEPAWLVWFDRACAVLALLMLGAIGGMVLISYN
jgi:hypothetical protein